MIKSLIRNILNFKDRLPLMLFGLLTIFIPMQKQWHKSFDRLTEKLSSSLYPFDSYFAGKMQFSNGDLFILCLVILALTKLKNRFIGPLSRARNISLIGYLTCCLVSIALSQHSSYPIAYYIFIRYALFWGLYWIIAEGLIERSFAKISSIFLSGTALSALMQAIISTGQYFKQYSLGLKRLGETSFARGSKTPASFDMDPASLWLFAKPFPHAVKQAILRSYGTFSHPNILGWYLAVGVIATLYLIEKVEDKRGKAALSLAVMLEVFALFTSYSRSALLGLIFSLTCYLMICASKRKALYTFLLPLCCIILSTALLSPQLIARGHYTSILPLIVAYGTFGAAGLFMGWCIQIVRKISLADFKGSTHLLQRNRRFLLIATAIFLSIALTLTIKTPFIKESIIKLTDEHRLINPLIAVKMVLSHPLLGTGFSLYGMVMRDFIPPTIQQEMCMTIHNIFLLIGAETGLLGLCFFLTLTFLPLWAMRKKSLDKESSYLIAMLSITLFVGMCDMHYLIFVQGRLFFFSLLALLSLSAQQTDMVSEAPKVKNA